jgi:hypothetical protein
MDPLKFPNPTVANQFGHAVVHFQRPVFRGCLIHPAIAADGIAEFPALGHGQGGLLTNHVFPRLNGQQRHGHVPVVRSGNAHGVDIRAGQDGPEIAMAGTIPVLVLLVDPVARPLQVLPVDIAHGHNLGIRLAEKGHQVSGPLAAEADTTQRDPVTRAAPGSSAQNARRDNGGRQSCRTDKGRRLQEFTA